ncbi:hypothetical protein GH714_018143 [Hevea brasiliensis]|uniref:Uncharacterized protein n=1 Tax=Hevea brasiliensis TaxID=3981 RepID=A0A6A6MAY6_HEVBR|nr:hypothetical protein GH714_018143 [Hevea brasiliensis]
MVCCGEEVIDTRNQILLTDLLPSVNKAYSTVTKFETQKQVLTNFSDVSDSIALFNKSQTQGQNFKRDSKKYDPKKGHCDFCNMDGHIREGCFKIIGYPDWFKTKNKGQQSDFKQHKPNGACGNKVAAMVDSYDLETPIEVLDANSRIDELSNMLRSIQQELQRMVKGKNSVAATAVGHSGSTSYPGTSTR